MLKGPEVVVWDRKWPLSPHTYTHIKLESFTRKHSADSCFNQKFPTFPEHGQNQNPFAKPRDSATEYLKKHQILECFVCFE